MVNGYAELIARQVTEGSALTISSVRTTSPADEEPRYRNLVFWKITENLPGLLKKFFHSEPTPTHLLPSSPEALGQVLCLHVLRDYVATRNSSSSPPGPVEEKKRAHLPLLNCMGHTENNSKARLASLLPLCWVQMELTKLDERGCQGPSDRQHQLPRTCVLKGQVDCVNPGPDPAKNSFLDMIYGINYLHRI